MYSTGLNANSLGHYQVPFIHNINPSIVTEGALWKRASVRCDGGEVEKKRRHRYGGLTHNSELGFESLLFCIV